MSVPVTHVLHQGAVLKAVLRAAVTSVRASRGGPKPSSPSPLAVELSEVVPPRSRALVSDYIRHVGGNPAAYAGELPAHLFPQWAFPIFSRLLDTLPYDVSKMLNGGAKIELHRPLPDNEPLHLAATLAGVDDDGRRAIVHQRVVTGTMTAPEAVTAHLFGFVPLQRGTKGKPRDPVLVGAQARALDTWRLGPKAGLDFALLTGDFNPIHWIPAAGRAAGFGGVILHGFGSMSRAIEGLNQALFAGDVHRLASVEVRFVKPLKLPQTVSLFLEHPVGDDGIGSFSVGKAPGAPAFLTGTFTVRSTS